VLHYSQDHLRTVTRDLDHPVFCRCRKHRQPFRRNLIHMIRMLPMLVHVHHSYASYGQSSYVTIFHGVINRVERIHCSWEKRDSWLHLQHTGWPIWWSPPNFSPPHSHWKQRGKVKHLLTIGYISLLGSYLQYVISTFNTCSWVPSPQLLTDTDGGYNLGGDSFPHHYLRPSQPTVFRFPLRAMSGLKLTLSSSNQPQK
jgi:hypothetical protein